MSIQQSIEIIYAYHTKFLPYSPNLAFIDVRSVELYATLLSILALGKPL